MGTNVVERAIELYHSTTGDQGTGGTRELLELSEALTEALPGIEDGDMCAKAAMVLAMIRRYEDRAHESIPLLRMASESAEEPRLRSIASLSMAWHLHNYREFDAAMSILEGLDREQLPDDLETSRLLYVAIIHSERGEVMEAREVCARGLSMARGAGFANKTMGFLFEMGTLSASRGEWARALDELEEARDVCARRVRDEDFMREVALGRVPCLMGSRHYDEAQAAIEALLETDGALMGPGQHIRPHDLWVELEVSRARWDEALEVYASSERLFEEGGQVGARASRQLGRGIALALGESRDRTVLREVMRSAVRDEARWAERVAGCVLGVLEGEERLPEYEPSVFVGREVWEALERREAVVEGVVLNGLESALLELRGAPRLWVSGDWEKVSVDRESWVSLMRRPTSRKIMRALGEAWPDELSAWELHDAVWPGAAVHSGKELNRLYIAIHRLRDAGLGEALETSEGGYRLKLAPRARTPDT